MKKTRILYLITTSKLSGAEKMLYELATGINKNKYEIIVCTIKDDIENQLLDLLKEKNIETKCLEINRKWKFWKLLRLIKIIKEYKPQVIQGFLFFDNIVAILFGKIMKVPVIIAGQRNAETERSKIRNFIEKNILLFADYIVSNSMAGKNILIKREEIKEEKIKVIYNGINIKDKDDKKLQLPIDGNKIIIGFVGRLTKQKGLEYLIKAIEKISKKIKNINLVIIGDGEERENLEKLIKELDLENNIYFTGHKNKAWQYMKNFDLFVLPSLWEGTPNSIIEAMSNKLPIIATRVGGTPELITDKVNGLLTESKNSQDLIDKIEYVLSLSGEERKKLGQNAWKTVEKKFSLKKMIDDYEQFYLKILNS